ncbi:uncharacterized protein LOC115746579 isoform X5 [Rhodamnia argentea]|uniref:Uncharacterized protein LOC115746579 isoform X5 n=1 Tax=Rhodamnia argentea TaxID=178133 RepID=A0ABM3HDZ5_9MYRT|nr:uncharacterized protein LOC115746579 isoform X5 [Rhodamnia argentea]
METRIYPMNFEVKEIALSLQQAIAGYGFRPTDEELINYLKSEVPGWRGSSCIIPTLESIYNTNPWDLPAKFNEKSIIPSKDQEWWFICPQSQNQRISRKTPCGFSWNITGKPKDIKARNDGKKIGSKKTLVFLGGVPTNWVIHEYHLLNNDLNRNYVLCHIMRRRDEEADNSTTESEHGANYLADLEWYLHQPDPEESFDEYLIQARMDSLIESSERSVMDFALDDGLTDEYIQLVSETSEEDEDVGYLLNGDLVDADFFHGDQMQTLYGQTPNLHNECPVLMENRRAQTMDSIHGVVPLEEKKGLVENKFSGSLVALKKPMAPPVRAAGVKYYGKDEVLRFGKVKQETAATSIKPEYIFFDETAARAKDGQISVMESRQTRMIGSLHGVVPLEQKKGIIQSKVNSSHASSAKSMELPKKPKIPRMPEPPRMYINEELWLRKVKKQESALRNVKTECVSFDKAAATAKVLKYREHRSASNLPRKAKSRESEHAREKANIVTALTSPTAKSTKSSTNPPRPNFVNVLVGIFLFFAVTCQVFNL